MQTAADLAQDLATRISAAAGGFDRVEERVQLIEMELPDIVHVLATDRELEPRRAEPRAVAVGTGAFDHDLVEPGFHIGAGFATLPIAAIVAFDAACDSMKPDLAAFPLTARLLRVGRHGHRDFLRVEAVQDHVPRRFRKVLPRRFE